MTTSNGGDNGNDDNNRKEKVGYRSPPINGRIKPGEVRNPYGRNGRSGQTADNHDLFGKVASRLTRVIIDGEVIMVSSEESFWLKQMHLAQQGDKAAARNIAREFGARRKLGPPPLTADELAKQKMELAERESLAAELVELLELQAELKREGLEEVRYGPDGRPIVISRPFEWAAEEPEDRIE